MQCYSLDRTKPIHIVKSELENNQILVDGYAKTIHCSENQSFGSMKGLWILDPRKLKLPKHLRNQARQAKRTGNTELLEKIYASVLTQLSPANNNN
jgi:hypothetical protein